MASITQFIKTEPETDAPVTNVDNSSNWQYLVVTEETVGNGQDLYSNNKESGCSGKRQVFSKFFQASLGRSKKRQECIIDYVVEQEQSLDGSCIVRERHAAEEQSESLLLVDKKRFSDGWVRDEDDENDDQVYDDSGWQIAGSQSSGEEEHGSASKSTENYQVMKCVDSDAMKVPDENGCSSTASKHMNSKCGQSSFCFTTGKLPLGHTIVQDEKRVPKKRQKCEVCGKDYLPYHMKKHMLFHTGERNYPCSHCGKRFFTKGHCRDHEKIHDRKKVCEGMKCSDSETMKVKGSTTDSKGEQDDKTLEKVSSMGTGSSHQDMNNVDRETIKVIEENGSLNAASSDMPNKHGQDNTPVNIGHLPLKHMFVQEDKNIQENLERCEVCGKYYPSNYMKRHMMFHTGERKYPCTLCGKRFFTKGHCRDHEKIHEKTHVVMDLTCPQCGRECVNLSGFRNHIRVHDRKEACEKMKKKLKKCEVCGKCIPPKDMKKHVLFHTEERNYPCSLCGKMFFTKSHCRSHEKIHDRKAVCEGMKCIDSETMKVKGSTTDSKGERDDLTLEDKEKVLSINSDSGYQDLKCVDSDIMKVKGPNTDSKGEEEDKTLEKVSSMGTGSSHRDMNYGDSGTVKVLEEDSGIGTASQYMTNKCANNYSPLNIANLPLKHTFVLDYKRIQENFERREVCGKYYPPNYMKRHMMSHTGERKYSCRLCGKRFLTKGHCWIHEQTHVVTDLTCPQCGRECVNLSGFRNHTCMRVHDRKEVHEDTKAVESETMKVHVLDEDSGIVTSSKYMNSKCAKDNSLFNKGNLPLHHTRIQGCAPKNHKKCEVCGKYIPLRHMKKHMLFHSGERNYPCSLCGKRFFTKSHCRSHEKIHNQKGVREGMKCIDSETMKVKGSTTDSKGERENKSLEKVSSMGTGSSHRDMNNVDRKTMKVLDKNGSVNAASSDTCTTTKCAKDSSLFNIEHLPLKHTPVEGDNKSVPKNHKKCEVCGKLIPLKDMKKHMLFHSGERNYPCSLCGKKFFTKSHCRDHEKIHAKTHAKTHEPEDLTCSECGLECVSLSGFTRHMRVHGQQEGCKADSVAKHKLPNHDQKPVIICNKCGKSFKTMRHLDSHILSHSDVEGFECDICNKAFRNRQYLKSHKQIHTDQKPENLCHKCGKLFRTVGHLDSHMITHSDVRGFICNICNKTFRHRLSLKFHKQIHSGHRPYVCSICKMAFFTVTCLKNHERTHKGKTLFKCPHCDISFSSKYSLNLHVETHSEPEPHDCHLCKSTFVAKRLLDRHLEKFHGQERSQICRLKSRTVETDNRVK